MKTIRVASLFAFGFAAAAFVPETTAAARYRINLGTDVALKCEPGATSPNGTRHTNVTNSTNATIPKGTRIYWEANTQDIQYKHSYLPTDLAPGATFADMGGSGPGYTCVASMSSLADLVPWSVSWEANNAAVKVQVKDTDPWIAADASVARVDIMSCSGDVLKTYDSAPFTVPKGGVASVTIPATYVPGKTYLRLTVDATHKVIEHSETNNVLDANSSCVH